jgi:hypothetical protein
MYSIYTTTIPIEHQKGKAFASYIQWHISISNMHLLHVQASKSPGCKEETATSTTVIELVTLLDGEIA